MPRQGQQISLLNHDLWKLFESLDPGIDQVAIEIDEV